MKPDEARRAPVPLRALVFEDREEDSELSLYTLRSAGFEVVADVAQALGDFERLLCAGSYDIILSDYTLPDATGMDAFEALERAGRRIPFILVTGCLGEEKAVECLQRGVSDYVLKDRLARLPSAVARVLEEQQLRQERTRAEEALRESEEQLRLRNQELEEQNRRVEAASRMKSEFLANMSHELRSPLNGIIGFTQLLCDGKVGPIDDAEKECLERVLKSSNHLLHLINDLLDLAKIEAGKFEFLAEQVCISQLVAEVCDSLAPLAEAKQIRVEYQIYPPVEAVLDPVRFKQIVYNYLSNAIKFTPAAGRVAVKLRPEGNQEFLVEVSDTGAGISEKDIASLFTNFHQLDSGKNKRFQGAGLGLALTRRLVEAQGGRVGVRSVLEKGSTFFAVLPRVIS